MQAYKKEKQIGQGAFGSAWLVKSKSGGTLVAKFVNMAGMPKADRAVAQQEASVLSSLNHPNIIAMYEDFIDGDNLVIIMEYAGGGDLDKMLKQAKGKPLSEPMVLDLFSQILMGMEHVHSLRMLHRDIKPANILLTTSAPPRAKLADFGVARILSNNTTQAQTVIGTPYYLSPEMVESKGYNQKSDVWALGCVLYEMLALKHAFGGDNIGQVVLKIMKASPEPLPSSYGEKIRSLCSAMLSLEPTLRPSCSDALAHPSLQAFSSKPAAAAAERESQVMRMGGSDKDVRGGEGGGGAQARRNSTEGGFAGGPGGGARGGPISPVAGSGGARKGVPLPAPPTAAAAGPRGGRVVEVGSMDGVGGRPGSREREAQRPGSRERGGSRERVDRAGRPVSRERGGGRASSKEREPPERDMMGVGPAQGGAGSGRKLVTEDSVKKASEARVRRKSAEEQKEVAALPSQVKSAMTEEERMERQLKRLLG